MGIYLPNNEIPKSCENCWALDDYGDYPRCRITEEQRGYNFPIREKRMDKCPLVPVPEHGRLIDADELYKEALKRSESKDGYYNCLDPVISCYTIDRAPTIVQAEEGET